LIDVTYINTDSEKYDIKHGALFESPVRGSTAQYICNPIVDDIEADPEPKGRARRKRVNGRVIIDTTVPDGDGYRYEPPSCHVSDDPSVNNLAAHRWNNEGLSEDRVEAAKIEAELIRRIQDGARINALRPGPWKPNPGWQDQRAFRQLLEAFHRTVVRPAGDYVPGGMFYRRQPKGQKHSNDLLYEDLTSVGCLALWQSALKFDLSRRWRFNTRSRHDIGYAISTEANYLRRHGYSSGDTVGRYLHATKLEAVGKEPPRRSDTRIDRWIFDHLGASPEELLEAQDKRLKRDKVFHSLHDAAEALKEANNLKHPDVYSDGGDDDVERDSYDTSKTNTATEPVNEWRDIYDSHDPLYWSPQLAFHGNPLRGSGKVCAIVDFWIREFCDPPRIKAKQWPKPVYKPCAVKPTGRVLHPIDKPFWMDPRDKAPDIVERKPPYDPDRREVATVRLKNGKTKRQYRQARAVTIEEQAKRNAEWRSEYLSHPYAASYAKYMQENELKKRELGINVRPEPNKANGGSVANFAVFESRASREPRLHVRIRHLPSSTGERFTCARIAG
jgi:hypothetical protein